MAASPAGAPLSGEERVRRERCEGSKSEHLSLPTSSLVRVSWAPFHPRLQPREPAEYLGRGWEPYGTLAKDPW